MTHMFCFVELLYWFVLSPTRTAILLYMELSQFTGREWLQQKCMRPPRIFGGILGLKGQLSSFMGPLALKTLRDMFGFSRSDCCAVISWMGRICLIRVLYAPWQTAHDFLQPYEISLSFERHPAALLGSRLFSVNTPSPPPKKKLTNNNVYVIRVEF